MSSNNYFICGSGTDIVKSLTVKSQNECHAPGQYVFRVDGSSWHTGKQLPHLLKGTSYT